MRQAQPGGCVQAEAGTRAKGDAQEAARRRQRALMSPEGRRPGQKARGRGGATEEGPGGDTVGSGCGRRARRSTCGAAVAAPGGQVAAAAGLAGPQVGGAGQAGAGPRPRPRPPRAPGSPAAEVWERAQLQGGEGGPHVHPLLRGAGPEARWGGARGPPARRAATPDPEEGPLGPDAGRLRPRAVRPRPSGQSSGSQEEPTHLWTQLFGQSS